jgi:hypothetical protein
LLPFLCYGRIQNPIPGLPALEAADRRLEAITPTPADQETGGTPPTPADQETGAPGSSAIWQTVAALLVQIGPDVRYYVQRLFERTLEAAEADLALPPERRRLTPRPFVEQQRASVKNPVALHWRSQRELGDLLRQALWRAVDALEAAALVPPGEAYLTLLEEQCAQFGLVYAVLKQRAGPLSAAAAWIAYGELRLLHHRGSRTIEQMLLS